MIMSLITAPNNENHLLHNEEYQFFVLEWIWGFGEIGWLSLTAPDASGVVTVLAASAELFFYNNNQR